jgi:hypothetical protein
MMRQRCRHQAPVRKRRYAKALRIALRLQRAFDRAIRELEALR